MKRVQPHSQFLDAVAERTVEAYEHEAPLDFHTHLGAGPIREVELAGLEYRRLSADHSDAEIGRYLEAVNPRSRAVVRGGFAE